MYITVISNFIINIDIKPNSAEYWFEVLILKWIIIYLSQFTLFEDINHDLNLKSFYYV